MTSKHRLRFELILASSLLGFGLFVLPGLIYWVGTTLLGPYGENAGVGPFYADFYGDLASGVGRTWALAAGPLLLIALIRLLFLKRGTDQPPEEPNTQPVAAPQRERASDQRRVEPRVSLD